MLLRSCSLQISASPDEVYAMISDVERIPEWSPECVRVVWKGESHTPEVGARFRGQNKYKIMRWTTTCEIQVAEAGSEFAFSTMMGKKELNRWTYAMEARDGGTFLTEKCEQKYDPWFLKPSGWIMGLMKHPEANERGMRDTLDAIKAAAEAE